MIQHLLLRSSLRKSFFGSCMPVAFSSNPAAATPNKFVTRPIATLARGLPPSKSFGLGRDQNRAATTPDWWRSYRKEPIHSSFTQGVYAPTLQSHNSWRVVRKESLPSNPIPFAGR
ncbi:hypothetical protein FRC18_012442 [Serendipita sp. 400]|nr:hypothetical protein FRC18_012442 [Serendipita sp. 400]